MKINEEIEDWYLCYPLSVFIDSCTKVNLELLIKCINYYPNHKDLPFLGAWLDHSFYQSEIEYPTFCTQLHKKISNSVNLIAIEQDLKDDFLNKIDTYLEWYEENRVKILLSKEDAPSGFCPFTIFKATCEATKTTIFKYFPQLDTSKKSTNNGKTKEEAFDFKANIKKEYWGQFYEDLIKNKDSTPMKICVIFFAYVNIGAFDTLEEYEPLKGEKVAKAFNLDQYSLGTLLSNGLKTIDTKPVSSQSLNGKYGYINKYKDFIDDDLVSDPNDSFNKELTKKIERINPS